MTERGEMDGQNIIPFPDPDEYRSGEFVRISHRFAEDDRITYDARGLGAVLLSCKGHRATRKTLQRYDNGEDVERFIDELKAFGHVTEDEHGVLTMHDWGADD